MKTNEYAVQQIIQGVAVILDEPEHAGLMDKNVLTLQLKNLLKESL